jgi:hypothetical protein
MGSNIETHSEQALSIHALSIRDQAKIGVQMTELLSTHPAYASELFDRALGIPAMLNPYHADHTAGMLGYEPMHLREIAALIHAMNITPGDVFCDLGGGFGRPSLLVHLLTGARCVSVEFIESTHNVARQIALNNGISGIEYVHADARDFEMSLAN